MTLPGAHNPVPGALELRLSMGEAAILAAAEEALMGCHATALPAHIGHPADDFDIVWRADSTAILTIRQWQDVVPPFRHAVAVITLSFATGRVASVDAAQRVSFGA